MCFSIDRSVDGDETSRCKQIHKLAQQRVPDELTWILRAFIASGERASYEH
jgi:hypothetical protein